MNDSSEQQRKPKFSGDHRESGKGIFLEIFLLLSFFFGYISIALFGLKFIVAPGHIAGVWPVSGFALAVLLLVKKEDRYKYAIVIFAANVVSNINAGNGIWLGLGFAAANTAESVLCASIVSIVSGNVVTFTRLREAIALTAAATMGNAITASIGASVAYLGKGEPYLDTWLMWWAANGLGMIVITPLIVSWVRGFSDAKRYSLLRYFEGFVTISVFFFTSLVLLDTGMVANHYFLYSYFVFPFFIWSSIRFGMRGNTAMLAAFSAAMITVILTYDQAGDHSISHGHLDILINNQMYLAVVGITVLVLVSSMLERKNSMWMLAESERKLKLVAANINESVFAYDLDGRFIYMNPTAEALCGCKASAFDNSKWKEMVLEEDIPKAGNIWDEALNGKSFNNEEFRIKNRNGDVRWMSGVWSPMLDEGGNRIGVEGMLVDVTEKKLADERLVESEMKYRTILQSAMDGFWLVDLDGRIFEINDAYCAMSGYSKDEVVGKFVSDFSILEDRVEATRKNIERVVKAGGRHFESAHRRKDGSIMNLEINLFYLEKMKAIAAFHHDITRRKNDERILREAEREKTAIVNAVSDIVLYISAEKRILWSNDAASRILQIPAENINGCSCSEFWGNLGIIHDRCYVSETLETGKASKGEIVGAAKAWRVSVFPVSDDEGKVNSVVQVLADVTERKAIEDERIKTQKLESLGVLAGGIAHDFNNILTSLWGNIQLLSLNFGEKTGAEAVDLLKESERACKRARELTQQLLTFAKGGEPVKKAVALSPVISESVGFALRGTNVRCHYNIEKDLWQIEADEGQMSQVFNNLVINSVQAMPNGGVLTVSARNVMMDGVANPEQFSLAAGRYVYISITDQGVGIPPDYLNKIFDPYFSTKQRGSGLGLTTVYSIVQKHGGRITVESEQGVGTTFHIYLPALSLMVELPKKEKDSFQTGQGKILVMDDEAALLKLAKKLLMMLGYEVETALSGEDAVDAYKNAMSENKRYKAVILDLTVPGGMGGKDCVIKLKELDPNVTAIVTSGYSNDPVMANYQNYGFKGLIVKPYSIEEISKVLASI